MKGGLAVMVEVAAWLAADPGASDLDVGLLFFGREELPIIAERAAPVVRAVPGGPHDRSGHRDGADRRTRSRSAASGNLNARVSVRGEAAHTARPWLGRNAIHAAIRALAPIADLPRRATSRSTASCSVRS